MVRIDYGLIGKPNKMIFSSASDVIRIGSDGQSNDIVLRNALVSSRHAVLSRNGDYWELKVLGENDVLVGNRPLRTGERAVISFHDPIQIFPFSLVIEDTQVDDDEASAQRRLDERAAQLVMTLHSQMLQRMELADTDESRRESDSYLLQLERDIEELIRLGDYLGSSSLEFLVHCAGHSVQGMLLSHVLEDRGLVEADKDARWRRLQNAIPDLEAACQSLASELEYALEVHAISDISGKMERIEKGFREAWRNVVRLHQFNADSELLRYLARRLVIKQIKDIFFGYGPLEDLIRMPNISEIMVVSRDKIYIEKNGVLENSGRYFVSDDVTESIIGRIVSLVDRRIDKANPLVDARLLDGSRVNAIIHPLALSGPCVTIRKFPAKKLRIADLIAKKSLTQVAAQFLHAAVQTGCNILISGGTGSGKTTLLNCLSDYIPDKDRIVTIEDTAELRLQKEHVVRLETKIANVEGKGAYTIRDLVRNALRMRPDRIVVGECRGPEALDMLQAMNTGHDGSMTTIHANTSEDVIQRLEVLVQMAANLPLDSIHRQIASAIDLVVQLTRMRDGSRRVTQITEFVEYDQFEKRIRTKDLFRLEGEGSGGLLMPTGCLPTFMGELIEHKYLDLESFYR